MTITTRRHLHAKESAEEVDVDDDLNQLGVDQGNAHLAPLCKRFKVYQAAQIRVGLMSTTHPG